MVFFDLIRFVIFVEMAAIIAITLRIWSVYALLAHYFPKERRLLPIHVALISVAHLLFALGIAGSMAERLGENSVAWNVAPLGLIGGTLSIIALVALVKHEHRELDRVRELIAEGVQLRKH